MPAPQKPGTDKVATQPVSVPIKLPALDRYLQDLQGDRPVSAVTRQLASQLYRGHEPHPLPAAIQQYYTGPASKAAAVDVSEPEPFSPARSEKYAHVRSRVVSCRPKGLPALPYSTEHTTLTQGLQVRLRTHTGRQHAQQG